MSKTFILKEFKGNPTPRHPFAGKKIDEVKKMIDELTKEFSEYSNLTFEYAFICEPDGNRYGAYHLVGTK